MEDDESPLNAIKLIAQDTRNSTYQFQLNAAAVELTKLCLELNIPAKKVVKKFMDVNFLLRKG